MLYQCYGNLVVNNEKKLTKGKYYDVVAVSIALSGSGSRVGVIDDTGKLSYYDKGFFDCNNSKNK